MIHCVRNDVIIITGTRKLLNGMSITGSASNGNRTQRCDYNYRHEEIAQWDEYNWQRQ